MSLTAGYGKVLGEAIYLFEPDSPDREIDLPYDFGAPFGSKLRLPSNLHVLGTMNSTDRSLAVIDIAVRRRFAFAKLWPQLSVVESHGSPLMLDACEPLLDIFVEHATDEALDLVPGHSYFLAENDDDAKRRLRVSLLPLLQEYVSQGFVSGFAGAPCAPTCNGSIASSGGCTTAPPPNIRVPRREASNSFEATDSSMLVVPASNLLRGTPPRDIAGQSARLGDQFIERNRAVLRHLGASVEQQYRGHSVDPCSAPTRKSARYRSCRRPPASLTTDSSSNPASSGPASARCSRTWVGGLSPSRSRCHSSRRPIARSRRGSSRRSCSSGFVRYSTSFSVASRLSPTYARLPVGRSTGRSTRPATRPAPVSSTSRAVSRSCALIAICARSDPLHAQQATPITLNATHHGRIRAQTYRRVRVASRARR